eukprot:TRINITY_DN56762_c0_g1_i1.p1 TRINITY_DN56762_c0_g1~~TRINITY_DN56762_c0_g1_i1.p1  ORF type:complete len:638 (+),score=149.05 TRINITY_DN56762_c0_g1_i1:46-1914(+)
MAMPARAVAAAAAGRSRLGSAACGAANRRVPHWNSQPLATRVQPSTHTHAESVLATSFGKRDYATGASAHATPSHSPLARYNNLVSKGEITRDTRQEMVVKLLDDMAKKLANHSPRGANVRRIAPAAAKPASGGGGIFGSMFGGGKPSKPAAAPAKQKEEIIMTPNGPKGLYVWGGCGTGKTFLMDLFYDSVNVKQKKRIHFHEWMIDVHDRLHRLQKQNAMVQEKANAVWTAEAALAQQKALKEMKGADSTQQTAGADDLVAQVASEMLSEAWLLCFDEFQVTHISDAIIMKRLFSILWEKGCIVIATSNRPPKDLYLNGLNRPLFLPFIPMLESFCDVHDIASAVDYRLITTSEEEDRRVYIHPNGKEEEKLLERKFYRICHGEVLTGAQVETQGRRIMVPKAAVNSNVAWFRFKDLCDKPLGAADYLAVASAFHTIFVADIPKLTLQERDQVRRFITLVDAFYEKHTKMVCTAEEDPIKLFYVTEEDKKTSVADEIFAWDRTVSRLVEMQSAKYLSESARSIDGEQFLGQFKLTSLTEDDLDEMWRRYDRDDNGTLDAEEVRHMLADILEKHQGHRNVSDEVHQLCMEQIDADGNGVVDFKEFEKYMKDFSTLSTNLRL